MEKKNDFLEDKNKDEKNLEKLIKIVNENENILLKTEDIEYQEYFPKKI